MSLLIQSAMALSVAGAPDEIVYLPEGEHQISATVDGKPKTVLAKVPVDRGQEIATSLQDTLEKRQQQNVRPWFDFEHKRGVASALPKAFRYEPGKGIMCSVEWTGAGRRAIEGKDFSYFSPEFYLGDDGVPDGIPERGPLGGLVNEPAFRDIPRIAAKDAKPVTQPSNTMSKLIFAALAISSAAENAESEAVKKIEGLKTQAADATEKANKLETENAELKQKVEAAEAEAKKERKQRADNLVKAAVADGRILPKDDDTQKQFREKIEAGDSFAEAILGKLPKINPDITTPLVKGEGHKVEASDIETKAAALVKAGQAPDLDTAIDQICANDPKAYQDYLATLG